MGRGGRRRKQLLHDLEENRIYWYLKRKALHHSVCGKLDMEKDMDQSKTDYVMKDRK